MNIRTSAYESEKKATRNFSDEFLVFRDYQRQLDVSSSHLESLLYDTTNTLDLLSSLSDSFKVVESQTTAFQSQCEGLISEQKRLTQLADGLSHNLRYYSFLEPVTKRLNAPGASAFARSEEFSNMLARLDECLEYMAAHVCSVFRISERD